MIKKKDIILSITSGILITLGFPLFNLYPLAWVSLVPLLISLRDKGIKDSFRLGILTGMTYYLGTIYWVYHSMYVYGYLPLYVSILILLLLCLYLSVYVGLFSMIFNYISGRSEIPAMLTAPVIWVTMEYIRTYALTGYPWALIGYTQYTFLPVIQIADMTGVYGVSFLILSVNGAVFDLTRECMTGTPASKKRIASEIIIMLILIGGSVLYGLEKLDDKNSRDTVRISVLQGNIPQDKKWDAGFQRDVIETYKKLSKKVSAYKPDLVVWPETAVPFIYGRDKYLTEEISEFQRQYDNYLLFGAITAKENSRLANSAVLMSPDGTISSVYDKMHLVPYGEYVPLRRFLPFIDKLTVVTGDFATGKTPVVMETPFAKIGNLICYEIIFPGLVRKFVENGANLLVTITNDAWFGRTSAPDQHFSKAVFRAVENRVPVARAANTGISGFIDSRGRILDKSSIFIEESLTGDVAIGNERSLYTQYGDVFAYLCIVSTVCLAAVRFYVSRD